MSTASVSGRTSVLSLARLPRRAALGVLALFLLAAPWLVSEYHLIQLNYIGVAAIVALGLVLLTGVAGVMSFGQQVFAGVTAYTTAVLCTKFGGSAWVALLLGMAMVTVLALFLGAITLRLSGHYLPIATIAWGIAIYFVFGNLELLGSHSGLSNIPAISIGSLRLDTPGAMYGLIWLLLVILLLASSNLLDSRTGRAMRTLRARTVMAESFGIDTFRLKLSVFLLAALFAGLSGWLYAHFLGFVSPSAFNVKAGIDYLFMIVLGGASSVWGALLGASVLTAIKEILANTLPSGSGGSGNYEVVLLGALILLLLQRSTAGLAPLLARYTLRPDDKSGVPDAPPLKRRALPAQDKLLEVAAVSKRFGGLVAVRQMSFEVRKSEILGLIGPNGAGKSTMFNMISGVLPTDGGSITYRDERIDTLSPSQIARRGIARTFQHVHLLGKLSVLDNVAIGAHLRGRNGMLASMLRLDRAEEKQLLAEAARQAARVGLQEHLFDKAGTLPLGKQRLVEIARALCADPALLLLDEPAAGLRYAEKKALAAVLRKLREEGVAILLVEHDMEFLMNLADRVVVMQFGELLTTGSPQEVQANPAVIQAYLGGVA